MKLFHLFLTLIIIAVITFFEWPKIDKKEKKEKVTYIFLTTLGFLLGVMLIFFPDTPGPTQLVGKLFLPLSKILE